MELALFCNGKESLATDAECCAKLAVPNIDHVDFIKN